METVPKGAALKYDCYAGSVFALFWVFTGRIKTPRNWFVNVSPKHQLTLHYTILKYIQINMFCCPIRPPTNLAFLFTSTGQQICYFTNTSKSHVFSYWRVQSFKTWCSVLTTLCTTTWGPCLVWKDNDRIFWAPHCHRTDDRKYFCVWFRSVSRDIRLF